MKIVVKKIRKYTLYLLGVIAWIYICVWLYSFIFEQDKLAIDRYNFAQLEKAKPILESIPTNARKFYTLKEFNEQYKADIKQMKNCYYVSNDNWNQRYIFWFQLEALITKMIYLKKSFYSYLKYDLPYSEICITWKWCYDHYWDHFRHVISNSCKD